MDSFNLNSKFLIISVFILTGCLASLIKFENGEYNGITIGIDGEKVLSTQCKTILENLTVLLPLLSDNLYEATEQKGSIGEVNVLLPYSWTDADCNLTPADDIRVAKPNESFRNSHLQITHNHSLAEVLPWTRQFRPCGQPGDSIVIPIAFLENTNITNLIKAQILLHEWAKFRYGVFDEFGFEQEEHQIFSPCYTYANHGHFTSCSSPVLPAVVENASICSLEFLSKYSSDLIGKLGDGATSVMSFPYHPNFNKFCDAHTHNRWAPTKQNFYCNRKSVREIVFSHSDFFEQNFHQNPRQDPRPRPRLVYLRHKHSSKYDPAYVIVIEDSQDMRNQYKILHVKQAMAQFLEILEDNTNVHLIIFEGNTINHFNNTIKGDDDRKGILNRIPDITNMDPGDPQKTHQRSISLVINKLIEIFNNDDEKSWHVLLFANSSPVNSPINDFSQDIAAFGSTPHTISIFTFENAAESNSQEWLQWYSIPNTRNVVALPFCTLSSIPKGPCSFQTSAFILDQIVGNLNDQQFNFFKPRFFQTLTQVSIPNILEESRTFDLEGDPKMVKRLYLFMTLPTSTDIDNDPSNYIEITGIDGLCDTSNLLGYGHVIKFSGINCTFKSGQWKVAVTKQVGLGSRPLLLNVFVEMNNEMKDRLIVTPSLSTGPPNERTNELSPNQNIYPVYVSLQTQSGHPVLFAQVTLNIFHPNLFTGSSQDKVNGSVIILRDDGSSNGPDQTGNDGIYSGYLSGFSSVSKTFHLVQIQVTTTSDTKIMESSIPSKAVLLNAGLTNKCCGKVIHKLGDSSFQPPNLKFQTLHFGFKTKEIWNAKLLFPPGPIGEIATFENNDNTVVIEFNAVAGDNTGDNSITVTSYQACCVPSNETETMQSTPYPDESNCKANSVNCGEIKPPNERQTCSMNKENLVKLWIPAEDQKLVHFLRCALRAINSNGELGALSQEFVEVRVSQTIEKLMGDEELQCKNLFDDKCLPFWVFWVLIGCLAGVLLVLLVVVCWWCCARRRKKKETTSTVESGKHPPKPTKENVLAVHYSPHPQQQQRQHNSYNHNDNSVEDVNTDDSKVVKEIFVNHAYIQDGDGEIKIIADNGQILRKPKNDSPLPRIEEDPNPNMQVFKPAPMPTSKPNRMPRTSDHARSRARRHNDRPQIVHSNPMLRSDSSYNSLERPSLAQRQQQPPPQYIPSPRNTDPALVYATISRTGPRLHNQQQVSSPKQLNFDPHYMIPHNSVPVLPQPSSRQLERESSTLPRSPPKVPYFPPPISDSETSTDFDMRRRGARRLPPQFTKPPPYPEGSQLVTIPSQQTPASNDNMFRRGIPVQPRPVNPPVPPPRFDRQTVPVRTRNNGPIKTFSTKPEMVSSDEEDSDEWDDGDNYEFENTTGVSYA